ncbi:MAG: 3-hydroxyacyl-CoA dehydrogenase family protein, partial [Pseudomonadota bacterium]
TAIRVEKEISGHIANRLQAALLREAMHLVAEGVGSVEDVDQAIAKGPGLRWAMMGPIMTFNLGGGRGGLERYLEQFTPVFNDWFQELGQVTIDQPLRDKLVAGVKDEMGPRSMEELERWRDETFLKVLEAVASKEA